MDHLAFLFFNSHPQEKLQNVFAGLRNKLTKLNLYIDCAHSWQIPGQITWPFLRYDCNKSVEVVIAACVAQASKLSKKSEAIYCTLVQ
jgi:hypothetical protein